MVRIASFDIGQKNFAFYVEEFDDHFLGGLSAYFYNLDKKSQKRSAPLHANVVKILYNLCKRATCIDLGVFDIRRDKTTCKYLDIGTRLNMYELLESYRELWDTCDIIIVEKQYYNKFGNRGSEGNIKCVKLGECCMSWFLMNYGEEKQIQEFSATFKTQVLGAPKGLTKAQRKKWSIEKGRSILESRGDSDTIDYVDGAKNYLGKRQKQDDVYDCLIMAQAFKMKYYVWGDPCGAE